MKPDKKLRLANAAENFNVPAEQDKPIHIPFGNYRYDDSIVQSFDRAHAETIAKELNAKVAAGNPGIPVYQGHPDVPALAAKYPDKGALGWIVRIELTDAGVDLFVDWDRFPGQGFKWFSPYWFGLPSGCDQNGSRIVVVDHIESVGLVNNPNIAEFRLPNESIDLTTARKGRKENMNITKEELVQILGLGEDASDDQIRTAIKAGAQAVEELATERTKAENAEADKGQAEKERDEAKTELENCRKQLDETKTALANEKAQHEKTKALKTQPVTVGLANAANAGKNERIALVNEIMQSKHLSFAAAWNHAKTTNPELFK